MSMYSREVVAEVLAANDIVQIIGAFVELKGAGGGRKKGLCPFHREKTPSFVVSQDKQIYNCFGCGKHGDAISFVMEHEGLAFVEALQKLADRGNVRLPAPTGDNNGADGLRKQLLDFNQSAAKFYRRLLLDENRGKAGRVYLDSRRLKPETVERFGLGFAPEGWSTLLDGARTKGTPEAVLGRSGLFKDKDGGGRYDAFRNRLMFPIKDVSGNVVAFGGRALDDSPAKYINSPETDVYRKSRVLYALHEARDAMRREKFAILVEGYFDALRCFDAGIENVVATCGTALTAEQASLIRRYVPSVVIVYDGDAAGIQAALKGTGVLTAAGLAVRAMALPGGQDPDDFIRDSGGEAFNRLVSEASDFVTFYARQSESRLGSIEGRTQVAHELFDILRHIEDEVRLDEYLGLTAERLGLNPWACRKEYEKYTTSTPQRKVEDDTPEIEVQYVFSKDDCDFLAALMRDPALLDMARKALEIVPPRNRTAMLEVLEVLCRGGVRSMQSDFEREEARRLYAASAAIDAEQITEPELLVSKRLKALEKESLRIEAAETLTEIQEAERAGDPLRLTVALQRKVQLKKQLERIGAS